MTLPIRIHAHIGAQGAPLAFRRTTCRHARGRVRGAFFGVLRDHLRDSKTYGIIILFSATSRTGSQAPEPRTPRKQSALCAIGLPFAGMLDPVSQGVFLMRSST